MIKAEAWSDCGRKRVEFDAAKWFEQASDSAILGLVACDFELDYPADEVAMWTADYDENVAGLFEFIKLVPTQFNGDTNGFECRVNPEDAMDWIRKNKG